MLNKLGDMGNMMKQMKELKKAQKELKKIQKEITKDSVKVVVNGELRIVDIKIEDTSMGPDKLGKIIRDAINEGMKSVQFESAQKLSSLTGGLNIPGLG